MMLAAGQAAGQGKTISLTGRIVDAKTGQGLEFASIRCRNIGTLSNQDGYFLFKISAAQVSDSVEISFVGYKTYIRTAGALSGKFNTIALQPAVRILNAVVVRAKSGLDLIKEFVARIPENYDTTGKNLQAFYRELIMFGKDTLNANEAVLEIYKSPYGKAGADQMVLLKGRHKKIPWIRDPMRGWISNMANGAKFTLVNDLVKNYMVPNSMFNPSNFKYYNYVLENTIDQGNKSLYIVSVTPIAKFPHSRVSVTGRVYFNTSSMAMERMELQLAEGGIRYLNHHRGYGYRIMSVAYQASYHFTEAKVIATYAPVEGKWSLQEIRRDLGIRLTSAKRNLHNEKWHATSTLAITAVQPGVGKQLDEKNNIMNQTRSIQTLMLGKDQDKEFWANYNIVQPSFVDTLAVKPEAKDTVKAPSLSMQTEFTRADTLLGKLTPLRTCYDVGFYHLEVRVDPPDKFIQGTSHIVFKATESFSKMQIDLYANMKIEKILWRGMELAYAREYGAVYITFPSVLEENSIEELSISYSGHPQEPNRAISMNGGFLWDKDKAGKPWVQVVCQGSGASLWWPCKDHLSDEPDSARITVTVPEGVKDISNGRLTSIKTLPGGLTQYDWHVFYPINNYNITLNIGDYQQEKDFYKGRETGFPITYYWMPGSAEKAKLVFKRIKPMLAIYEKDFGPYPFPKDGFTAMESLYPMEHQGAVSIGKMRPAKIDTADVLEIENLMYHECAHEWWGNSVSIKDYADFWIHEAFATYAEALMIESSDGDEASADYMNVQVINSQRPIIGIYGVNHIHYEIGHIYNKGCLVLNTLRHLINNDTLWFSILRGIQSEFRYQTVTTRQVEDYIASRAKLDLHAFFDQYLRRTKPPRLFITLEQHGSSCKLRYKWEADVPDFEMPVRVTTAKGKFGLIHPTTSWKTMEIKNLLTEDFEVDERSFYIDLEREN